MPASATSSSSSDEIDAAVTYDMGASPASTPHPGTPPATNLDEALAAMAAAVESGDRAAIVSMASRITALSATGSADGRAADGGITTSHPGNAGGGAGSAPAPTSPLPVSSPAPAPTPAPAPVPATAAPQPTSEAAALAAPPPPVAPRSSSRQPKRKQRFGDNGELEGAASRFRSAPPSRKASVDPSQILAARAQNILEAKPFVCRSITIHAAGECITAGLVSVEDCHAAGIQV